MKQLIALTIAACFIPAARAQAEPDYIPNDAWQRVDMRKFYQFRLPLQPDQQVQNAYLIDDALYVTASNGYVYALHAPTGILRWFTQVTTADYEVTRPAHLQTRVVFSLPPKSQQYLRVDGRPIRKIDYRFPAASPPTSDGFFFFVGGLNNRLYAFNPEVPWETWKVLTTGSVRAAPAYYDDTLYYATDRGVVYAARSVDRDYVGINRTFGPVVASPLANESGVFVASRDRSLYAFDLRLRGRQWRARFQSPLVDSPVLAADTIFQYSRADGLAAINLEVFGVDERIRWMRPDGLALLTTDDRYAYVFCQDSKIKACRLDTGVVEHTIEAPGFEFTVASTNDPAIFLVSRDGRIYCARKKNVPLPTPEQMRLALAGVTGGVPVMEQPAADEDDDVAAAPDEDEDPLASPRRGAPVGGTSKISKGFGG